MASSPAVYERALVTGASSGIGEAFARVLAGRGVDLIVVARRQERLEQLAGSLRRETGVTVEVLVADLIDPTELRWVAGRLADRSAPVDLVVNNAGFGTTGPLAGIEPERVDREIRLNVGAVAALTRAALPGMVARRQGAIVNVSSVVGFCAMPGLATYAATKAFVTSFSEAVAQEVRGSGIRVQALCPGLTRTEFQQRAGEPKRRLPSLLWQDADRVVQESLAGLDRGRVVVVPGVHNRAFVSGAAVVPRAAARRIVSLGQRLRGA